MSSNVLISIASEFSAAGFKAADRAVSQLTKRAVKLTGSFLTLQKAQQAALSFMADEKGTKILAQNLKNLGLGFATQSAEEFIKTLQKQTGVLDDELRPAYAQLARVTGSTIETQNLMKLAFDVASGTGQEYTSVIDALSQAYVGNYKSLRSLNIGLTQAELKGKSFNDIVAILNKQFKGSGDASLDSYYGKMQLLKVAASDASEVIGKSLLDALSASRGPNGFAGFIKEIEKAANLIADLLTGLGRVGALIDIIASPSKGIGDMLKKYRALRAQWDREDLQVQKERSGIAQNATSYFAKQAKDALENAKTAAIQKKLEADRLSLLKKQNSEKRAQAAIDKANTLLAKAGEQFNLEGIQLQAALANQTLTIEERKRLEVKQAMFNLEQALAQKDQERITSATALLEKLLNQLGVLNSQAAIMKDLYDLFAKLGVDRNLINLLNLEDALNLMNQMAILGQLTLPANFPKPTATMVSPSEAADALASALSPESMAWYEHELMMARNRRSFLDTAITNTPAATGTGVVINVTENANKLIDLVVNELQDQSASGISTRIARNTGGYNW